MNKTMLARITAMLLVVILLLTGGIGLLGWTIIRDRRLNDRLDSLKKDAREIAYIASQNTYSSSGLLRGSSAASGFLKEKAAQVYEEYGAYILVLDARGRVMDNMDTASASDPDFAESLNGQELSSAFLQVLQGEEIAIRLDVNGQPTFTVGVPFMQNGMVLGAVLIHTPAQNVESGLGDWLLPLGLAALAAVILGTLLMFFYIRSVLRPLRQLTKAAGDMAAGDFSVRVSLPDTAPEIRELAGAFDTMADRLDDVERGRREFVANVSHELRSPITSISGFIGGMLDGTIPPEEQPRYLKLVQDETTRLTALIGQLLALSRLERDDAALEWSDFDLCGLLNRAVIRRVNDLEAKHMDVESHYAEEPCMVHADLNRIEQVIINLMDNAIRFTPDGGRITLTVEEKDGKVLCHVADNGTGILPEDRPHVFERFFTADRAHTAGKGTGLGLAISQRIMEMHGETIRLEDTENITSFVITLQKSEGKLPSDPKVES